MKRLIAFSVTAAGLGLLMAATPTPAYRAPRSADGKPDWNGIWQSLNTANWDIQGHAARASQVVALGAAGAVPAGLGVIEGNEILYLPAAVAKKKENFENRLAADPKVFSRPWKMSMPLYRRLEKMLSSWNSNAWSSLKS